MNCVILKKRATIPRDFQKSSHEAAGTITAARGTILIDVRDDLFEKFKDNVEVCTCISLAN